MIYQNPYITSILIFFISISLSYLFISHILLKYNLFKKVSSYKVMQDRWGDSNKPHIGGLALSVCASLCCLIIIFSNSFVIGDITQEYKSFIGLFFVILLSTIIGIVDEKENIQPLTKTILQLILVSILLWAGFIIPLSNFFYLNIIFSMLWLFFFINATNMFDNVDLSLGIFSIISFFTLLIINLINGGSIEITYLILTYIGSLLGFLFFNKFPSKLFMGDIGSLQLGTIIGALSIKIFWYQYTYSNFFELINILIINNLIFLLIFIDVIIVVFVRLKNNRNPFKGDTNHFAHMTIAFFNSPHISEIFIFLLMTLNMLFFFYIRIYSNYNTLDSLVILLAYCFLYLLLIFIVYKKGLSKKAII